MVEPLRHRQTKGAATDMFCLTPPRHISTLPFALFLRCPRHGCFTPETGHSSDGSARQKCAINTRHPYCDAQWRGTATIAKVATHTTRSPRMFMLTQAVSVFHKGQIRFNHFV